MNRQKPASEQKEQIALIRWARLHHIPIVHIPNEGPRIARYGANLVKMGLCKGFPDLFIPTARGGFYGLFIEMKQNRRYRNSEMESLNWKQQEEWCNFLNRSGYLAKFAYGWQDASKIITLYKELPITDKDTYEQGAALRNNANSGESSPNNSISHR